jgi:hypothetical protein
MNRLDSNRPRYFVPVGLKRFVPSRSDSTASSPSIPAATTPATSTPPPTPALRSSQSAGGPALRSPEGVGGTAPSSSSLPPAAHTLRSSQSAGGPALRSPEGVGGSDPSLQTHALRSPQSVGGFPACAYRTADGRRCRMLRSKEHAEFCSYHAQQELRALERSVAQPLAREILGSLTDMRSGAAVNHAMANLFVLSADGRVSGRRAAGLGYLGRLLLQSLSAMRECDWRGSFEKSAQQTRAAKLIAPLADDEEEEESQNDS